MDVQETLQIATAWLDGNRAPLSALAIGAGLAAPIVALRLALRHNRKRRIRQLYADLRPSQTAFGLRPGRGGTNAKGFVGPNEIVNVVALPLENNVEDPAEADLVEAFNRDMITLLDRRPSITVHSVTYNRTADATDGLPIDISGGYLIDGAVELVGGVNQRAVRLILQILEIPSGERIFSDRFEGPVRRLADMQDEISESISGALGSMFKVPDYAAPMDAPTKIGAAQALYNRGRVVQSRGMSPQRLNAAVRVFDHAARIDPGFAAAKRALARSCAMRALFLTSRDMHSDIQRAETVLAAARSLQPDVPELATSEGMLALAKCDTQGALNAFARAAKLDPTMDDIALFTVLARLYAGDESAARTVDLEPETFGDIGARALAGVIAALADAQAGRLEQSHQRLEEVVTEASAFHVAWLLKAQVLALLGRKSDAEGTFARARRVMGPADPERVQTWIMRAAGSPERAQHWLGAFEGPWKGL